MAVLHLIRQYRTDVPVIWNNTGIEYPETYAFKQQVQKLWGLTILEAKPAKDFWWVVENYGFPLFSRKGHADPSKQCCRYLKEYPVERILRQHHFDLYFTGLRKDESRLRSFSAKKYGAYFYSKRYRYWKCHPIQNWTEDDVWEYHQCHDLPYNQIYNRNGVAGFEVRTACWACTIPIKHGKVEFLRKNYPKMWKHLIRKGLGKRILQHKTGSVGEECARIDVSVESLLESRPCFFDRL